MHRLSALLLLLLGSALAVPARAEGTAQGAVLQESIGRPDVHLDRLTFPALLGASLYKKHVKRELAREARKADWGVGRNHRVEYRFTVEKLELALRGKVLHVTCEALGELPSGRRARSKLSFGGSPRRQRELVKHVLSIVARGVVTRLAELERIRRGELPTLRVQAPPAS